MRTKTRIQLAQRTSCSLIIGTQEFATFANTFGSITKSSLTLGDRGMGKVRGSAALQPTVHLVIGSVLSVFCQLTFLIMCLCSDLCMFNISDLAETMTYVNSVYFFPGEQYNNKTMLIIQGR